MNKLTIQYSPRNLFPGEKINKEDKVEDLIPWIKYNHTWIPIQDNYSEVIQELQNLSPEKLEQKIIELENTSLDIYWVFISSLGGAVLVHQNSEPIFNRSYIIEDDKNYESLRGSFLCNNKTVCSKLYNFKYGDKAIKIIIKNTIVC